MLFRFACGMPDFLIYLNKNLMKQSKLRGAAKQETKKEKSSPEGNRPKGEKNNAINNQPINHQQIHLVRISLLGESMSTFVDLLACYQKAMKGFLNQ